MPRKKQKSVGINEDDNLILEKLTKQRKITKIELIGYYIQIDNEYDIYKPDWKARFEELDKKLDEKLAEEKERITRLDTDCPALIYAENSDWCIWGVDGKPPAKKKLAKDRGESLEICAACKKTLEIKLENESYQVKVQELEMKLRDQSNKKFKIPQCSNGARLDVDGLAFEGCPRSRDKPVSIESYCKKLKNGAGCDWFKLRLVGVGTET